MAAVLLVSQSWAVTSAYADYSIDESAGSNDFVLEGSAATQDDSVSEEHKSDGIPKNSESKTRSWLALKSLVEPLLSIQPKAIS